MDTINAKYAVRYPLTPGAEMKVNYTCATIADARKHAKALGRRRTELRAQDVRIENADGLLIEYGPICR